jgi:CheY-like chemotaxis protein
MPCGQSRLDAMPVPSPTILIVDDEPRLLTALREILEDAGYGVLSAPNGPEALRVVTHHPDPIDLVVTDLLMPGMGGLDLARQLFVERPTVKVLFLSGYADKETIAAAGLAAPILQKPISANALLAKVQEVLTPRAP